MTEKQNNPALHVCWNDTGENFRDWERAQKEN